VDHHVRFAVLTAASLLAVLLIAAFPVAAFRVQRLTFDNSGNSLLCPPIAEQQADHVDNTRTSPALSSARPLIRSQGKSVITSTDNNVGDIL